MLVILKCEIILAQLHYIDLSEIMVPPHQLELRNPRRQPAEIPLVEEEEKEIEVDAAIERRISRK